MFEQVKCILHGGSSLLDQQNDNIDPRGGPQPHEGPMLCWPCEAVLFSLESPVKKEVSDDFDRLVTCQRAGKIYSDRTKLAMFPVLPFSFWMSLFLDF